MQLISYIPNDVSLLCLCNNGPGSRSLLDFNGVDGPDIELRLYAGFPDWFGTA